MEPWRPHLALEGRSTRKIGTKDSDLSEMLIQLLQTYYTFHTPCYPFTTRSTNPGLPAYSIYPSTPDIHFQEVLALLPKPRRLTCTSNNQHISLTLYHPDAAPNSLGSGPTVPVAYPILIAFDSTYHSMKAARVEV